MNQALIKLAQAVIKSLTGIVNLLVPILSVCVVVFIGYLGWSIVQFFRADASFDDYLKSRVVSVQKDDTLVTSIAALDLMWLKSEGNKPRELTGLIHEMRTKRKLGEDANVFGKKKIEGYCNYSLNVYFGYQYVGEKIQSILDTVEDEPVEKRVLKFQQLFFPEGRMPPTMVAIEPEKISAAPNAYVKECVAHNLEEKGRRPSLEEAIENSLQLDGVWDTHIDGARKSFAAAFLNHARLKNISVCQEEGSISCLDQLVAVPVSGEETLNSTVTSASLGSVSMTVSSIYAANATYDHWFWSKDVAFYIQKDVIKVIYGSNSLPGVKRHKGLFSGPSMTITYQEPSMIAVDRRTVFSDGDKLGTFDKPEVVERMREKKINTNLADHVNEKIGDSVDRIIQRIEPRLIELSKATIAEKAKAYQSDEWPIRVQFIGKNAELPGAQLLKMIDQVGDTDFAIGQ